MKFVVKIIAGLIVISAALGFFLGVTFGIVVRVYQLIVR
jgi:hypothetical protein